MFGNGLSIQYVFELCFPTGEFNEVRVLSDSVREHGVRVHSSTETIVLHTQLGDPLYTSDGHHPLNILPTIGKW